MNDEGKGEEAQPTRNPDMEIAAFLALLVTGTLLIGGAYTSTSVDELKRQLRAASADGLVGLGLAFVALAIGAICIAACLALCWNRNPRRDSLWGCVLQPFKTLQSALMAKDAGIVDALSKMASAAVVLTGAWWMLSQFTTEDPDGKNLLVALEVRPDVIDEKQTLLFVDVTLRNVGKVRVSAGEYDEEKRNGLRLTVREYKPAAVVPVADGTKENVIDWNTELGKDASKVVLDRFNMLESYNCWQTGKSFSIAPGNEFHERVVVPVATGKLYGLGARFFAKNWTNADFTYVRPTFKKTKDKKDDDIGKQGAD